MECQYMVFGFKKWLIAFTFCSAYCPPPVLKQHTKNVCWHNSALQLVRMIKPITEELIADKKKSQQERHYYGKGNAEVDAYIDFIDASMGNDQKKIDEAIKKLYGQACAFASPDKLTIPPLKPGSADSPDRTFFLFKSTFPELVAKYCDFGFKFLKNELWPDAETVVPIGFPTVYENVARMIDWFKNDTTH